MKSIVRSCWVITFIATLAFAPIVGAEELTLDDCIELALKNRASIIRALGNEKIASAEKWAALGAFMPRISGSASYSEGKDTDIKFEQEARELVSVDSFFVSATDTGGNPLTLIFPDPQFRDLGIQEFTAPDQDRTSKSMSLSAQMNLFNIPTWFNYAAARANHESARLNVLASEQDLIYSVKVAYSAFLLTHENLGVQQEAVRRADEQLKLIESRFELGSASKSDVLKQKVQYGNDRLELLRAENAVTNNRAYLAYTIGLDPRQNWEFETSFGGREYTGTLDEAIEFGLTHKPSLLAAEAGTRAAGRWKKAAMAEYFPTITGWASMSYSEGTRGDTVTFDQSSRSQSFGVQLNWNIFNGFSREAGISRAKIAYNNSRAELTDAKNLAVSDIKTAYLDIEQLREQKTVSQENVNAAEEDLRITQEKYNLGAATILDLLDAQVSMKDAQRSLIRVDFDLNLAIAKLENAMGKM
ncbi:MAG: TolC family protein [Candidatus Zixiibacteriota bacterium]|nr:MAG: TolC family protein [candidate division Zixibacteria bacterium]